MTTTTRASTDHRSNSRTQAALPLGGRSRPGDVHAGGAALHLDADVASRQRRHGQGQGHECRRGAACRGQRSTVSGSVPQHPASQQRRAPGPPPPSTRRAARTRAGPGPIAWWTPCSFDCTPSTCIRCPLTERRHTQQLPLRRPDQASHRPRPGCACSATPLRSPARGFCRFCSSP
jgi:hypothetical protein